MNRLKFLLLTVGTFLFSATSVFASEANLAIPDLHEGTFHVFGLEMTSWNFLFYGALIITGTLGFSLFLFSRVKKLPAHNSMLKVAGTIYQTCSTYLKQQGKFLLMLFALIAVVLCAYFFALLGESPSVVFQVLMFSIIGMGGSYAVA